MKILNFGSLNIDKVYAVEEIVKGGETIDSVSFSESVGGKGLNQSIAVAKAGGNIMHAGCVGKDGEILLQALKDNNVDTSLIKTVETASGQAIIIIINITFTQRHSCNIFSTSLFCRFLGKINLVH